MKSAGLAILLFVCAVAHAQNMQLRISTVAPAGTVWAREIKAFTREVAQRTGGEVTTKWYMGGIAGDEATTIDRVHKGQLDGIGSGGIACERLAPSFRALRLLGLYHNRDEVAYVAHMLRPVFDDEFKQSGFVNLGEAMMGPIELLSRTPIRNLDDLRRARIWVWDQDEVQRVMLANMGMRLVPLPVDQAAHAYDDNRTDIFLSLPTAALAFQWSAQARYVSDLRLDFMASCLVLANSSFDRLSTENKQIVRAAAAKLHVRLEGATRTLDRELLGGLFAHQGLTEVPVSTIFHNQFAEAASRARAQLDENVVPHALVQRVTNLVEQYRRQHREPGGAP